MPRLVYTSSLQPGRTVREVKVGHVLELAGETIVVDYFREPHKPESEGKVTVKWDDGSTREFYVSIIGAKWIERTDGRND
jgi:hypothetical protein